MSTGSVCKTESLLATFDFAGEIWKVDVFACGVMRSFAGFDVQFPPLLLGNIRLLESDIIVGLWMGP